MSENSNTILIVDDNPVNIRLLYDYLGQFNYRILTADSGSATLNRVKYVVPDLIILDVMMPSMNGYEVCRILKDMDTMKHVPVLFITALDDLESKRKAFEAGGVDFISKPFQQEEVLLRVRTHLELSHLRRKLEKEIALKEQVIADLDAYAHTVAHDLKNPLQGVMGLSETLLEMMDEMDAAMIKETSQLIHDSSIRMNRIIQDLLLLSSARGQEVELIPVVVENVVQSALGQLDKEITEKKAIIKISNDLPVVTAYPAWLEQVFVNLLSNALKYGGQPPEIECSSETISPETCRISIKDNGSGLSSEQIQKLFKPFTRLEKSRAEGTGLGLTIVDRIIKRFGGSAAASSRPGAGTVFSLTLPVYQEDEKRSPIT